MKWCQWMFNTDAVVLCFVRWVNMLLLICTRVGPIALFECCVWSLFLSLRVEVVYVSQTLVWWSRSVSPIDLCFSSTRSSRRYRSRVRLRGGPAVFRVLNRPGRRNDINQKAARVEKWSVKCVGEESNYKCLVIRCLCLESERETPISLQASFSCRYCWYNWKLQANFIYILFNSFPLFRYMLIRFV